MTALKSRAVRAMSAAAVLVALLPHPARATHAVSLTVRPDRGVWGTTFTFRGFTTAGTDIRLQRRFVGQTLWTDAAQKQADSNGYYFFFDQPSANADYRSVAGDGSLSNAVRVLVRVGVHIAVRSSGERAVFYGRVLPAHPGTRVILQMFDGVNKRWLNIGSARLSSSSEYGVGYRSTQAGRRLFRVAWPTQDDSHQWNLSAEVFVTWVRS